MNFALDPVPLRARRPLTDQERALARTELDAAIAATVNGGVAELESYADLLGRQSATPAALPPEYAAEGRARPLIYRFAAEALLIAAAARLGLDPETYVNRMEAARVAEASIPEEGA